MFKKLTTILLVAALTATGVPVYAQPAGTEIAVLEEGSEEAVIEAEETVRETAAVENGSENAVEEEAVSEAEVTEETEGGILAEETVASEEASVSEETVVSEEAYGEETGSAKDKALTSSEDILVDLTDSQVKTARELTGELDKISDLEAGVDFVEDSAYFLTDSRKEAEDVAAQYGAELVSFQYGVAELGFKDTTVEEAFEEVIESVEVVTEVAEAVEVAGTGVVKLAEVEAVDEELAEKVSEVDVEEIPDTPVYPNLIYRSFAVDSTNDPLTGGQWFHNSINTADAWAAGADGSGVTVAVIDSGIDSSNNDLTGASAQYVPAYSYTRGEDDNGHGTHCAGIIAGRDNTVGGLGVAPNARLISIKAGNSLGQFRSTDITAAIKQAMNSGAKVISMSFGSYKVDNGIKAAISSAVNRNIVCVAAAGNDKKSAKTYPAGYPGVISVGAYDSSGRLASFSNYGSWVDLAAPGYTILSTMPDDSSVYLRRTGAFYRINTSGCSYGCLNGTSMACPIVAGVAALVISKNPGISSSEVISRIVNSASEKTYQYEGHKVARGLDAAAAVGVDGDNIKEETTYLVPGLRYDGSQVLNPTAINTVGSSQVSKIKYRSRNTNIATVNGKGLITGGKAAGKTEIEAYITTKVSGRNVDTVKALITVINEVPKFTTQSTTRRDLPYDMKQSVTGLTNIQVSQWTGKSPKVATIDPDTGIVTILNKGNASFTATFRNGSYVRNYTVALKVNIPKISRTSLTLQTGAASTIAISNTTKTPVWKISDSTIADITPSGLKCRITAKSAGRTRVIAYIEDVPYECTLDVTAPGIRIASKTLKAGKSFNVSLTGTRLNSSSPYWKGWTSSNEKVAIVNSATGKVTAVAPGQAKISNSSGGVTNTCEVTVTD